MSMRIDLDAKVRTRDGVEAGTIERAVLDPNGAWVREYVVNTGGLLGRSVLVPSAEVEASGRQGDTLTLRLSKHDLDRLPTYLPERYVLPPVGWTAPVALGFPETAYLWPAPLMPPTQAPPEATPVRPAGMDEASDSSQAGSTVVRPDNQEIGLTRDSVVLDRYGNDVGVVDEMRVDPATEAVLGFTLRMGGLLRTLFGGGEKLEVTRSQIDHVTDGAVHLRLTRDELEQMARSRV
jgi:hypothetical protein